MPPIEIDPPLDYARCLLLANDPDETEEARCRYRTQMEEHVHRQLREGFRAAVSAASDPAHMPHFDRCHKVLNFPAYNGSGSATSRTTEGIAGEEF